MSRTIVYLTNEHPFYLRMLHHSLEMLVSKLSTPIPVKVYVIKDKSASTIQRSGISIPQDYEATEEQLDSIRDLGAEIVERPPLDSFFHANRQYFKEIETDSLLYIDADTFVFDDVGKLFDHEEDFLGAEAAWVRGRNFPYFCFDYEPGQPILPFSSGVLLWNNGRHKDWAEQLPFWMNVLQKREHPLGDWLYKQHEDCLLREEFSSLMWAYQRTCWPSDFPKLRHGYFAPEEVQLIRYNSDMEKLGQQVIFHCYTPNWKEVRNRLDGNTSPKISKLIKKRSNA